VILKTAKAPLPKRSRLLSHECSTLASSEECVFIAIEGCASTLSSQRKPALEFCKRVPISAGALAVVGTEKSAEKKKSSETLRAQRGTPKICVDVLVFCIYTVD
jgi:hypothetical protein